MGVMQQANKLNDKEKEDFLKEYHEAKKRLADSQKYSPAKKARKKSKPRNGKVVTTKIEENR